MNEKVEIFGYYFKKFSNLGESRRKLLLNLNKQIISHAYSLLNIKSYVCANQEGTSNNYFLRMK